MEEVKNEPIDTENKQQTSSYEEVIKDGNYIVIRRTHDEDSSRLIRADRNKSVFLAKQKINMNGFFGHPFGTVFELDKGSEVKAVSEKDWNHISLMMTSQSSGHEDINFKDNRFVLDDNKSQKLSQDEIESFKTELSGNEMIENLVKNCSTFKEKTAFAQAKYLKKKQQKYSNYVTVLKPNVRLLAQMYYAQGPVKINYLRIDTLAQMLSLCNVTYGCNYMVVDSNLGILSAAVLERIGSKGCVMQVFTDPGPVSTFRQAVDALNLDRDLLSQLVVAIQINHVYKLLHNIESESKNTEEKEWTNDEEVVKDPKYEEKHARKEARRVENARAKEMLKERNMDGLVMVVSKTHDPLNILQVLYEFLANSRPFVLFCPNIEPLIECHTHFKKRSAYLRITETFLRKYQVLPDRTRPEMSMSGCGGFLLSGIKIEETND